MSSVTQLSFSQTLCKAVALFKGEWKSIIKLGIFSALAFLPLIVLGVFADGNGVWEIFAAIPLWLLEVVFGIFFIKLGADIVLGHEISSFKGYWTYAISRFWKVLWTVVLMGVLTLAAFLAFIIPGLYLGGSWYFGMFVAALEDQSGLAALSESRTMTYHRWWEIMAYNISQGIIGLAAFLLLMLPAGLVGGTGVLMAFLRGTFMPNIVTLVIGGILLVCGILALLLIVTPVLWLQTMVIYQNWKQTKIAKKA